MGLVRRSPTSRRDYGDIWSYVAERTRTPRAIYSAFDATIQLLSDHPRGGPARPDLGARLRSFPVGEYIILYRPIRGGIELARVVHGARDFRQIFKRRRE
jgi:toxin ParE1/3/4